MESKLKLQMIAAVSAVTGLIVIGTISYRFLEGWTWIQSFYFSVTTLSTVGYGDFYPSSEASRLFTAIYILIGASIALASLGIIGTNYIEKRENKIVKRRTKKH